MFDLDLGEVLPVIHWRNLGMMGEQAQRMMVVSSPTLGEGVSMGIWCTLGGEGEGRTSRGRL